MRKTILNIILVLVSAGLSAQSLSILHFNDTHSHIDPERAGEFVGRGGIIEQAALIDSIRAVNGKNHVLLLHAGDFGQGSSYFTLLKGDIEIQLLNDLGFDVTCLGNHEFDNGLDELARRLKALKKTKVVCANYDFSQTPLAPYVKPYVIVKRGGYKIGIIGLLTDVRKVVDSEIAAKLDYNDPVTVTNQYAEMLKNGKHCDLVLCLTHIGFDEDCELAGLSENVDIVVGGHSHTLKHDITVVKNKTEKPVQVVTDWCWGRNMGELKISGK